MGRKRFNAKARSSVNTTIIKEGPQENVMCDFYIDGTSKGYDESNALILPSKKRATKVIKKVHHVTKILSKKQRKKLEKVVDKKKKKENRSTLLEALAKVQVPNDELIKYVSLSTVQSTGVRKFGKISNTKFEENLANKEKFTNLNKTSGITGGRKKVRYESIKSDNNSDDDSPEVKKFKDPNIVGLNESSESESDNENICDIKDESSINITKENDKEDKERIDFNNENKSKENQPKQDITIKTIKTNEKDKKPTVYIHVEREPEIQIERLKLPILAEEQVIMETINENSITIIAGETGSGKTTQVPQFLYEAGYAEKKLIGITEPRRVAAISMSKRVAKEMNLTFDEISYLIRFEGNVTDKTKIKFMTDGILLKEIENDFLLLCYSVIILDEAHERSVNTDILIGLLSRIVFLREKRNNPLKLIIMSATLRVEDFTKNSKLFKIPPPVLNIETRQYPVTIHFQKTTPDDYVLEAFKKVSKIHARLPEGGILVFLTGQREINHLVKKLRRTFPYIYPKYKSKTVTSKCCLEDESNNETEIDMKKALEISKNAKQILVEKLKLNKIDLNTFKLPSDDTDLDILNNEIDSNGEFNSDDDDINEVKGNILTKQPLWVLPLYSLLSSENQSKVFEPPPPGCRLCIISTNIAETSLTIPNIKYVVDSGKQKTRLYDKITGVSTYIITFTSKASADQRSGRAGRTSAGHCYRLYSSAVYVDEFPKFSIPDIQRKPVDELMLYMKSMGIDKVKNFPFPSPPDIIQLETAEKKLELLGALEKTEGNGDLKVTPLGYAISVFPVSPKFGKMLALSHQQNMLPYTVCLVAALSVQEVLIETVTNCNDINVKNELQTLKWYKKRCSWIGNGNSMLLGDPMVLLRAVGASEYSASQGKLEEFCEKNGIRSKSLIEIRKLRVQLTNEINLNMPTINLIVDPNMKPPTDKQSKFLRQILLAGMGDQIAKKITTEDISDKEEKRKFKYAYQCHEMEEPVFIHSSSVLKKNLPNFVIYQEVFEVNNGNTKKMFIRGITAIESEWLLIYVPKLCNIKAIKDDPLPRYNKKEGKIYCYVDATFGRAAWEIPLAEIEMPLGEKACRYFGMFFVNGEVFPKLEDYKQKLKTIPSTFIKSWSNLNHYVTNFIRSLVNKKINTKTKLMNIWQNEPTYLLKEYVDLLNDASFSEISSIWPPLEKET